MQLIIPVLIVMSCLLIPSSAESVRAENPRNTTAMEDRVKRSEPMWAVLEAPKQNLEEEGERNRRDEPLYVEEPRWVLLDERAMAPFVSRTPTGNDPFWVARGRRQDYSASSSVEEPFWAARGRRTAVDYNNPFWPARGRRSPKETRSNTRDLLESLSSEEPFWAARGRRSALEEQEAKKTTEGSSFQRSLIDSLSAEKPFWASRGRRGLREELANMFSEQPFWAARGKREASASAEEPFWAARGRRGLRDELASLSAEEPFWAARGRRGNLRETLLSRENFWPARGKKSTIAESHLEQERQVFPVRGQREIELNKEDETFWNALEGRLQTSQK